MSFFFDVWTSEGFILASDVRLITNEAPDYAHKIRCSGADSKIKCAIAVCGEYPQTSLGFFTSAISAKDSLRDIAHHFAVNWTTRFAGTNEYSAVHLVGFEPVPNSVQYIPQACYWFNSLDD